jgi:hypothetical protein
MTSSVSAPISSTFRFILTRFSLRHETATIAKAGGASVEDRSWKNVGKIEERSGLKSRVDRSRKRIKLESFSNLTAQTTALSCQKKGHLRPILDLVPFGGPGVISRFLSNFRDGDPLLDRRSPNWGAIAPWERADNPGGGVCVRSPDPGSLARSWP